jgi:hypothetical protein
MSTPTHLNYEKPLLLLGSCFSDEIGSILQNNGFTCMVNPGGTIFHPLAIANLLEWALNDPAPLRSYVRDDVHLSWDLSGTFYALSTADFNHKVGLLYSDLRHYLRNASHLLLTFGTAWAYELKNDSKIVANCHKAPATKFDKKLTSIDELKHSWIPLLDKLLAFNPGLQLIFTVSPVRHLKDGLVENTRSKARLHLLIETLCSGTNCAYFEAYEIVLDQLRDYSYFKEDGIHPNQKAVSNVWNIFQERFLDEQTRKTLEQWAAIQRTKAHRILYPDSIEAKKFESQIRQKETEFLIKNPQFKGSTRG